MDTILGFFHQGASFIVPFIILLGVLIFVHELGHFSVAKFFGIRVEVFSLGFGRKIFQKTWGDTTYCISVIPFGGYVKMYGDDLTAEIPEDQKRYSFSHQPVLPRIAVVLAGPLMNAFFAIFLFSVIAGVGEEVLKSNLGDIYPGTQAYKAGFRTDDVIKAVNGNTVAKWDDVKKIIEESAAKPVHFTVQRGHDEVQIDVTPVSVVNKNILSPQPQVGDIDGLNYLSRAPAIGVSLIDSPAAKAGFKTADIVKAINGKDILRWEELQADLTAAAAAGTKSVSLTVERDPGAKSLTLNLPIDAKDPMGGIESSDLYLSSVMPKSAAADAGILGGDKLVEINGKSLTRWDDVVSSVQGYKESAGPLQVKYIRDGKTLTASIVPRILVQTDGSGVEQKNFAMGIVTGLVLAAPETFVAREPGLVPAFKKGVDDMSHWTALTAISFVKLAQGKVSSKSIGGPLMIGKLASETWRIG